MPNINTAHVTMLKNTGTVENENRLTMNFVGNDGESEPWKSF